MCAAFLPLGRLLLLLRKGSNRRGLREDNDACSGCHSLYFSTDAEKEALPKNVLGVVRCIFLLLFKSNVFNVSNSAESGNACCVFQPRVDTRSVNLASLSPIRRVG